MAEEDDEYDAILLLEGQKRFEYFFPRDKEEE
eukprot:COSAG01_NODE_4903_length_4639_cov_3.876679_3_plen_32_part_00